MNAMHAMNARNDDIQLFTGPNIKFVLDRNTRGWICEADVNVNDDLAGQGCFDAEEWIYDRGFGG